MRGGEEGGGMRPHLPPAQPAQASFLARIARLVGQASVREGKASSGRTARDFFSPFLLLGFSKTTRAQGLRPRSEAMSTTCCRRADSASSRAFSRACPRRLRTSCTACGRGALGSSLVRRTRCGGGCRCLLTRSDRNWSVHVGQLEGGGHCVPPPRVRE